MPRRLAIAKATRRFKRFHLRRPTAVRFVELPKIEALVYLGDAFALEYVSDKVLKSSDHARRVRRRYRHRFGRNVKFYADPSGRTLLIRGGRARAVDWLRD